MTRFVELGRRYGGKPQLIALFLLCAMPVGLMTALATPPGQPPDEPSHLARAAGLLHGAVLAVRKPGIDPQDGKRELDSGVKVDTGLLLASVPPMTLVGSRPVVTGQDFLAARALQPNHAMIFVNLPGTAVYFPAAYVPATLGLAVGLVIQAPPFACFLLARLFMLAAFLALGAATLWVAAFGEALLLTVLLLPMTLFLAGSVNQDAMLVVMACLACAALTRGTPKFRWLGMALLVLVLASKPPYILLLAVFLMPLASAGAWRRFSELAIAAMPVALWVVLNAAFVIVPWFRPPYHPGPLCAGDRGVVLDHVSAAANLHVLLAHPARLITLPLLTLHEIGIQDLREMIGVLGALQIVLPGVYYLLWGLCLASSLLGLLFTSRPTMPAAALNHVFAFCVVLFTLWLMMLTLYLNSTNAGMDFVDGIQGRYFLPLLPFMLFVVPALRRGPAIAPLLPAIPAILMGLFDIGYVPVLLTHYYYLH